MAQRYEITESVSAVALVATASGVLVPGAGATATIKDLLGNNLTVYAAETGVTTATNPITTDAFGRIEGWVEAPDYDIVVTGVTSYTQKVRMSPPGTFNVKSYGARFDGSTNDTAAMQAASDAANAAGGGTVVFGAGTAMFTTLTYYGFTKYVGAGARATNLTQISGTAAPMMQPNATTGVKYVTMEDFALTATGNASNTGGLLIQGVQLSDFSRVQTNGTINYGFKVMGGSGGASSGDAMHNNLTACRAQNQVSGNGFQVSPASGGGSHPDDTVLDNCFVIATAGTGFRIDPPDVDAVGALGPDSPMLNNCRTQQLPIAIDIAGGQGAQVIGGRFERTGSVGTTMEVKIGAGTTNNPVQGVRFIGGFYATHGTLADFVWTDASTNGVTRRAIVGPGGFPITTYPQVSATTQPNSAPFVDSADGRFKFKDGSGVIRGPGVTKLYDTTLGSNTANFDITSIPAGYGALQIIVRLRTDRAALNDVVKLTLNADTGANYDYSVDLWAGGAASGSSAIANAQAQAFAGRAPSATAPANVFSASEIFIPGYDDASNQKSGVGKVHWRDANTGATSVVSGTFGFDWRSNSAITRITLAPNTGTVFITGSRVIVYGMP
jgi:hypothetical protein